MKGNIFKKSLVIWVIILLFGVNLYHSSSGILSNNTQSLIKKSHSSMINLFFDLKIKVLMKLGHIPSLSMCIIKNNTLDYKGYGYSNILLGQKPNKNTAYLIASISKTVTATALMQLYEKGIFDLDDDINNYLDFKVRNPRYQDVPITFRMLLAHQSSLGGSKLPSIYFYYCFFKNKNSYPYPMIKEMILTNGSLFISSVWNNFSPGLESDYSNIGFILLEYLVEILAKQRFSDYCKEKIFIPLKMSNTSFNLEEFKKDQLAMSYVDIGAIYFPLPFVEGLYGIGGLRTSIEDFSHYVIAHMNGGVWNEIRILNESTVKIMHTPQYPNNTDGETKYGLGWFIWNGHMGINPHGHAGCGYGMTTCMEINGSNDWAILFFMNNAINFSNKRELYVYFKILELLFLKAIDL